MKKAVIFDLDGTLSDSIHSIKYSGDKALEAFGYGPFTLEQYKYFVGDGAAALVRRALQAGGDQELVHFPLTPSIIQPPSVLEKALTVSHMDLGRPPEASLTSKSFHSISLSLASSSSFVVIFARI